jgi:hypothetical protein
MPNRLATLEGICRGDRHGFCPTDFGCRTSQTKSRGIAYWFASFIASRAQVDSGRCPTPFHDRRLRPIRAHEQ